MLKNSFPHQIWCLELWCNNFSFLSVYALMAAIFTLTRSVLTLQNASPIWLGVRLLWVHGSYKACHYQTSGPVPSGRRHLYYLLLGEVKYQNNAMGLMCQMFFRWPDVAGLANVWFVVFNAFQIRMCFCPKFTVLSCCILMPRSNHYFSSRCRTAHDERITKHEIIDKKKIPGKMKKGKTK